MQSLEAQKRRRDEELGVMKGRQRKWLKGLRIGVGVTAGLGLLGYGALKMRIVYEYRVYRQTVPESFDEPEELFDMYDELSIGNGDDEHRTRATLGQIRDVYNTLYPDRRGDEMLVVLQHRDGKAIEIRNKLSMPLFRELVNGERSKVLVLFGTKEWFDVLRRRWNEEDEESSGDHEI